MPGRHPGHVQRPLKSLHFNLTQVQRLGYIGSFSGEMHIPLIKQAVVPCELDGDGACQPSFSRNVCPTREGAVRNANCRSGRIYPACLGQVQRRRDRRWRAAAQAYEPDQKRGNPRPSQKVRTIVHIAFLRRKARQTMPKALRIAGLTSSGCIVGGLGINESCSDIFAWNQRSSIA